MNILLLLAHSIAEYDDARMFTDLGYDVFSIGAYTNPLLPGDDKRPALRQMSFYPQLAELVGDQMAAKANLPDRIIEWADVIICHHYLDQWIVPQWDRIKHKRVIWRTCGQSDPRLERMMAPLRREGLEIVRYSPCEGATFAPLGAWAGQDALIRFGKYLDDYPQWDPSDDQFIANVTQNMVERGEACGLSFYLQATAGLPALPAGPGSEQLPGGVGSLDYAGMLGYLRRASAYLYTGTVPASYTLGLIEAMAVGVPIVSIGPQAWRGPPELFEGHELAGYYAETPLAAQAILRRILDSRASGTLHHTVGDFDVRTVGPQWVQFLGAP